MALSPSRRCVVPRRGATDPRSPDGHGACAGAIGRNLTAYGFLLRRR